MRASREKVSAAVRVRPPVRGTLPAAVDAALAAPGRPLDIAVRREMERRFGHDFGDVRVHADMQAAAAARLLDADAFTSGPDIVFGEGRYQPGVELGRWLIAHELVHTLQQGGDAATSLQVSTPDTDPLEREADSVAARVVAGDTLPGCAVSVAAPAARGRIARRARAALERLPAEVPDSPEAVRALADEIARLLAREPGDRFGRVKHRLSRLAQATRAAIAHELSSRIPAQSAAQLRQIVADLLPPGTKPDPGPAPTTRAESEAEQPASIETERPAAGPEAVAVETPAPSETDEPDTIPEPAAVPEGPVAEPTLEGEVDPAEPEAAAVPAVEPADGEAGAETMTAVPATEAPEPQEEAADTAPVDDTEAEALEGHDAAEVEGVDEALDSAPGTAGSVDAATGGGGTAPEAQADTPDADAAPAEASAAREEAGETLDESPAEAGGEPPSPEQEPDLAEPPEAEPESVEDTVVEPPAAEMREEDEAPAEPPPAEIEGAEQVETEAEAGAGTEEPSDPQLTEESTPAEEAPVDVGGDEGAAAPIEEAAEPETPDLSEADPAAAMEASATLPPAQSEAALTSVDAAASRSVATQREALAEQPPELDRPTSAPTAEELAAEAAATGAPSVPAPLQRAPEPPPGAATRVVPLPPAPPPVAGRARAPQIAGGPQGELNEDGRKALLASLQALPVHDPALDVGAGAAPAVTLEGGADPQRAHTERDRLETVARAGIAEGRREIVKPAGEQRLVPEVTAERLRASAPTTPNSQSNAAPPAAAATLATDAASILAHEKRGDELRAAAKDAAAGMRTKKSEQAATAQEERRRSQEQVTLLVRDSAAQQAERRADARGEVHAARQRWSAAEHDLAEGKLGEADAKLSAGVEEVARVKTDADKKAATHIETGERDADTARRQGEKEAAAERKRGEEKSSSGVLGWLADKATALFDEIKAGITKAFEIARSAVRSAIETAKKLAAAAIDLARDAIVAAIRLAGDALIAIGDKLLAGFPGVRDRFRRAIEERVAKAQAVVNALADGLKNAVQKALDSLGAALDAALGLLEKGLLLIVDGYRAVVAGALKWADGLVKAFAAFAVLVKHVAANPKQWLRNLAASAKDGVRNHLWKAFQVAIKRWFWEKVEEVLGLGLTIWNLLKKGGLSLARIGSMAWEAIKTAIPPTLIQILIEKLISILIPAAAAVMLIIETLQAAWGTIQRVLEAFERFFEFLKAVRTGKAGPHFARAIAAAAVAVIDFVANWLLKRLRKPAGKIAKRLKALAKKLGKKLAKAGKGIKAKLFGGKRKKAKKLGGKPSKKPKPDKRAKAERRVKAASEFLGRQLDRGMPRSVLRLQIQVARMRWRVRIRLRERAEQATLTVEVNPRKTLKLAADYEGGLNILEAQARAAEFQGFLRERHQIHHVLPGELRAWWDAAGLDWNHEDVLLELPNSLHKAVHRPYREIDAKRARTVTGAAQKNVGNAWNAVWERWLLPKLAARGFGTPATLAAASDARKSQVRTLINRGKTHVVGYFSKVLDVKLWRFRLRGGEGDRITKRFAAPLAKLAKDLSSQGLSKARKELRILKFKGRQVPRVMKGNYALKRLRWVMSTKKGTYR